MKNIKTYLLGGLVGIFALTGIVAGANTISNFSDNISEGDIIGVDWFKSVSLRLGGTFKDGKMCTYASGKISCLNNIPDINSKIGSLTEGKLCSVELGKISCTLDNPSSTSGNSNWTKNGNNINYSLGNVGIGSPNPNVKLDVAGEVKATKFLDRDNSKYFLNPSSKSNLKELSIDDKNIYDIFQQKSSAVSNVLIMSYGVLDGWVDDVYSVNKPVCSTGMIPKIQLSLDWAQMVGDVDDNDLVGTWYQEKTSTWDVGGGNYDCGLWKDSKISRDCGGNVRSIISYTTLCVNPSNFEYQAGTSGTATGGGGGGGRGSGGGEGGPVKQK